MNVSTFLHEESTLKPLVVLLVCLFLYHYPCNGDKYTLEKRNVRQLAQNYNNHSVVKLHFDHSVHYHQLPLYLEMLKDIFSPWENTSFDQLLHIIIDKNVSSKRRSNEHHEEETITKSKKNISSIINVLGHIRNDHFEQLKNLTNIVNLKYKLITSEMNKLIDEQINYSQFEKVYYEKTSNKIRKTRQISSFRFNHKQYNRIESVVYYLHSLRKEVLRRRKNKVHVSEIGYSYEGQSIYSVQVNCYAKRSQSTYVTSTHECSENLIVLECGIHAREWISPAVCLWIIEYFSNRKHVVNKKVSFIIVPVVNPDGYRYTWTSDRLWRKNRSSIPTPRMTNGTSGSKCYGVDLNRNFDVKFNTLQDENVSPCSELYPGESAMSEPEVQSLVNYIEKLKKNGNKILAYFSIHSYSQLWMYPYGFSSKFAHNIVKLSSLAHKATQKIRSKYGTHYKIGSVNDLLYKVTGSSMDYFYMSGIEIVFAIELPDEGEEGFLLNPRHIEPTAIELLSGIEAVIEGLNIS